MQRLIIDVREPSEFAMSHVVGAVNIPPSNLLNNPKELSGIPKDTELVLYCNSGSRSNMAINYLKSQGYTKLINGVNKDHVNAKYT